jgi:Cys-rich protein (TIGR01571 family)
MPLLDQSGEDEWTSGLFQCGQDCRGTCDNIWCCSCQYGRQCAALVGDDNKLDAGYCVLALCCGGYFGSCLVCALRGKVRERFGIAGSGCSDFLMSVFCGACTNCQTHRELTNRGFWPGGSICASEPPGGMG